MNSALDLRLAWSGAMRGELGALSGGDFEVELRIEAFDEMPPLRAAKASIARWVSEHLHQTTVVGADDQRLADWAKIEAETHGGKAPYILPGESSHVALAKLLLGVANRHLRPSGAWCSGSTVRSATDIGIAQVTLEEAMDE